MGETRDGGENVHRGVARLIRDVPAEHDVTVERASNGVGDRLVVVIAVDKHGEDPGDRPGPFLPRTGALQEARQISEDGGRIAARDGRLDRIERVSSASTAKLDKLAQAQPPAPAPASAASQPPGQAMPMMAQAPATEITGSVPPPAPAPRKPIKGWSVRQAYEGIAILQGPDGVIEVVLGQQVPGLGRIEEIRNESGRLIVLSSAGAIMSGRKASP